MDLPPAQDELRLLVADLLQTLQLFEGAGIENLQDFLSGLLQHRCVELGLPAVLYYILFTIWRLKEKRKSGFPLFNKPFPRTLYNLPAGRHI